MGSTCRAIFDAYEAGRRGARQARAGRRRRWRRRRGSHMTQRMPVRTTDTKLSGPVVLKWQMESTCSDVRCTQSGAKRRGGS